MPLDFTVSSLKEAEKDGFYRDSLPFSGERAVFFTLVLQFGTNMS